MPHHYIISPNTYSVLSFKSLYLSLAKVSIPRHIYNLLYCFYKLAGYDLASNLCTVKTFKLSHSAKVIFSLLLPFKVSLLQFFVRINWQVALNALKCFKFISIGFNSKLFSTSCTVKNITWVLQTELCYISITHVFWLTIFPQTRKTWRNVTNSNSGQISIN